MLRTLKIITWVENRPEFWLLHAHASQAPRSLVYVIMSFMKILPCVSEWHETARIGLENLFISSRTTSGASGLNLFQVGPLDGSSTQVLTERLGRETEFS